MTRQSTRSMAPISAMAFATFFLPAAPLAAETVKLTLLGVGDVYNFAEEDGRGGFARLNAVARAERAANPNTLYVFDGDMLSPSIMSGFDKGQNTIDLTNLVPFDLAVPGNRNSILALRILPKRPRRRNTHGRRSISPGMMDRRLTVWAG